MTRDDFIAWASGKGYRRDAYGHFHLEVDLPDMDGGSRTARRRFKVGKLSVRYEHRTIHNQWVRLRSGYYRELSVTDEGKLKGLHR